MLFRKWPSINKFSDVYHHAKRHDVTTAKYRMKIKLHGTNSAIRIEDGKFVAQKRTSDISVGNDNAGFARFVSTLSTDHLVDELEGIIIYGEWAGPGVQKGDAVAGIDEKNFFVFSALNTNTNEYMIDPIDLNTLCALAINNSHIHVLPYYGQVLTLNFSCQDSSQRFVDNVMKHVDVIGETDPYISETFGVDGVGEGVVLYPSDITNVDPEYYIGYMFKAKTDAHTINKSKNRNHVAPEKPAGMDEFVDMFFTVGRFEQMLNEHLNNKANRKDTGLFLKAVMSDVAKESKNEIELADFEWKDAAKYGVDKTKSWFFAKADEL